MMRIPPKDLESERSILGASLLSAEAWDAAAGIVTASDFYSEAHAVIWGALDVLAKRGTPADTTLVRGELVNQGKLEQVGGDDVLMGLTDVIPTIHNAEHHAARVRDLAAVRRMITAGHEIAAAGYSPIETIDEYLDDAETKIMRAGDVRREGAGAVHLSGPLEESYRKLEALSQSDRKLLGVTSGIERLDKVTSGWCEGQLIIVAGRPGMGKSALAQTHVLAAARTGKPTAVFSLEMPKEQWSTRMMASDAAVPAAHVRSGQVAAQDWPSLAKACAELSELPIYIDDTPALQIMAMRRECRKLRRKCGQLGLIVVDYLQLMRGSGGRDGREQEVSEISRTLKQIAKEERCPVIALSQLNRSVETRGGSKRPQLSDLRESGAIEQDADTVIFVYRDEVYNSDTEHPGIAELIIAKQRDGPTGLVECAFISEYVRFQDLQTVWREPEQQEAF